MCDCYEQKCSEKGCNIIIPIHIADFCTPRENIKAYCKKHMPENCLVFLINDKNRRTVDGFPKNYKFGFEVLDTIKVNEFGTKHGIDFKLQKKLHPVVSPNTPDWEWIK